MQTYKLIRTKRRTLAIQINNNGELIARAPLRLSVTAINDFIVRKEIWIKKTQQKIKQKVIIQTLDKDSLYYLGTKYPLKIDNIDIEKLTFDGENFYLSSFNNIDIKDWYRKEFIKIVVPRLDYYAKKHNLPYKQLRIKNQKTIWGSCSATNNISLNYALIQAPISTIDYVLVHELCHIIHKNHSHKFWQLVASIMPNYKEQQKILKDVIITL